jgi:hypothetical protein
LSVARTSDFVWIADGFPLDRGETYIRRDPNNLAKPDCGPRLVAVPKHTFRTEPGASTLPRLSIATALLFSAIGTTTACAQERGTLVVPERPARVFVMAGFDDDCRSVSPVEISVDQPPHQGTISFRQGQETTVQYSLSGKCIGSRIKGTGIYYTGRAGAAGSDTFAVSARVGGGPAAQRSFVVKFAE